MKKTTLHVITLMLLVLLFPAGVFGEMKKGSYTATTRAGGYNYAGDQDLDNDLIMGVGVGYNVTDRLAGELIFNYGEFNHTFGENRSEDVDSFMFHLDTLYHFMPDEALVPYFAAGMGTTFHDYKHKHYDTVQHVNYGGGVKYFLTDNTSLRGDVRHIYDIGGGNNNFEYTFGVNFQLDKKEKDLSASAPRRVGFEDRKVVDVTDPDPIPEADMVFVDLKMEFGLDSTRIDPIYHHHLEKVANYLREHPESRAVIEGHTCNIGSETYNQRLSETRASNVTRYMAEHFGISPLRLSVRGYGESRPLYDNYTREGREKNRRVITAIDNKGFGRRKALKTEAGYGDSKTYGLSEEEIYTERGIRGEGLRVLRDIQIKKTGGRLNVICLADGPINNYNSFYLKPNCELPARYVVDIPGRWEKPLKKEYYPENLPVRRIRVGAHADKLRVVFDLRRPTHNLPRVQKISRGLTVDMTALGNTVAWGD